MNMNMYDMYYMSESLKNIMWNKKIQTADLYICPTLYNGINM